MGKIANTVTKAGIGKKIRLGPYSQREILVKEDGCQESTEHHPKPDESRDTRVAHTDVQSRNKHQKPKWSPSTIGGAWDKRLDKAVNEDCYLPEVFKIVRSRILHPREDRVPPRTIMITSATPGEGKTFISANLGISIALGMEHYSLMVNGDLRRPSLASMFGHYEDRGLVDYLRDHRELPSLIQKTSVEKLSLLPSGKPPVNPAELLGLSRMRDLVEELRNRYEDRIILFDSPPLSVASETSVLAHLVDGVIIVVREGGAGNVAVKKLIEEVGKKRIIGIVFNGHTTNILERSLIRGYGPYGSYSHPTYQSKTQG